MKKSILVATVIDVNSERVLAFGFLVWSWAFSYPLLMQPDRFFTSIYFTSSPSPSLVLWVFLTCRAGHSDLFSVPLALLRLDLQISMVCNMVLSLKSQQRAVLTQRYLSLLRDQTWFHTQHVSLFVFSGKRSKQVPENTTSQKAAKFSNGSCLKVI